jgi:hypothetical protein
MTLRKPEYIEPFPDMKLDVDLMAKEFNSIKHLGYEVNKPNIPVIPYHNVNVITKNKDLGILSLIPYTSDVITELRSKYDFDTVTYRSLFPSTCYRWHNDYGEICFNIPVITNIGSLFVFEDRAFHMPADGTIYVVNQEKYHTFVNAGETIRTHLLFENLNKKTLMV